MSDAGASGAVGMTLDELEERMGWEPVTYLPCDKCKANLIGEGTYERVLGCGRCAGWFCAQCRFQWAGDGPVGCPDEGFRGHGYDAEQSQAPAPVKRNRKRGW